MTNYDKIIGMNIREMANEINNGYLVNPCDYCFYNNSRCGESCVDGIMIWLRSEVKE